MSPSSGEYEFKKQYDTIHSFDNSNYTFTSKQRLHAKCNYNVGYKMA